VRVSDDTFDLAQVNIGVLRAPRDSPLIADFVANLEPINALADASPGFVWRLQGEGGDATSFRAFDSDTILINMSTWESLEALQAFVYRTAHTGVMRRRREWFEPMADLYMALWWVRAGHRPEIAEAEEKLQLLQRVGPSPDAFTFRQPFPPPG